VGRRRRYFGRVERRLSIGSVVGLFVAAAALHLLAAAALQGVLRLSWGDAGLPPGLGFMEVALVPPEPDEEDPALEPEPEPEDQRRERLVENHRILDERAPRDTDKVSEFDSRVDQEMRAPSVHSTPPGAPSLRGDDGQDDGPRSPQSAARSSDRARDGTAADGEGAASEDSPLDPDERARMAAEEGAAPTSGPRGLRGTTDDLARTFGRRGSMDWLDDVEEGQENLLNTKRTKFASFFNRVRNAVAQHWHPEVVHAARDPHGQIYGTKTRTTQLRISLQPDGSVDRIWVDGPSGVEYLDEEAIRAVRAAAPFTNPPAQLIDPETGTIDFSFNFILMIDGTKRIFRYRG
jgi:TonB family protein